MLAIILMMSFHRSKGEQMEVLKLDVDGVGIFRSSSYSSGSNSDVEGLNRIKFCSQGIDAGGDTCAVLDITALRQSEALWTEVGAALAYLFSRLSSLYMCLAPSLPHYLATTLLPPYNPCHALLTHVYPPPCPCSWP